MFKPFVDGKTYLRNREISDIVFITGTKSVKRLHLKTWRKITFIQSDERIT